MYSFIKKPNEEFNDDHTTVEFTVGRDDVTWVDLLDSFLDFLRGCGFEVSVDDIRDAIDGGDEQPDAEPRNN